MPGNKLKIKISHLSKNDFTDQGTILFWVQKKNKIRPKTLFTFLLENAVDIYVKKYLSSCCIFL